MIKRFWRWARHLVISTKEFGDRRFDRPLGTQRYLMEQIARGMDEGIHHFVVLKSRQLGISTVMLAFDLWWLYTHPGIQGALVTHDEATREDFRTKLAQFDDVLDLRWKVRISGHNRNQLVLRNKSSLVYLVNSARAGNRLGRSKALTMVHATEIGSYGDNTAGMAALSAAMAEKHPGRLFVFESTANGYDMFHEMYSSALKSVTQRAIFVPWWLNELYCLPENTEAFSAYFGKPVGSFGELMRRLESHEREWVKRIKDEFHVELTGGQIAWFRMTLTEKHAGDLDSMFQEYPPLPEYAFRLSGTQFFPSSVLNRQMEFVKASRHKARCYRLTTGAMFSDTRMEPCRQESANLIVWEEPEPHGWYVIGADVAYGSNEWKDGSVICVLRCFADKARQVAEYHSTSVTPTEFAWVIAVLSGWYGNTLVNLELNGPGQVVYRELKDLRGRISAGGLGPAPAGMLSGMREFRFQRFNGSLQASSVRHWVTSHASKERMLSTLRDAMKLSALEMVSPYAIEEMRHVARLGATIGAAGREKDDRVIAAALAAVAWVENVQRTLRALGATSDKAQRQEEAHPRQEFSRWFMQKTLKDRGIAAH